MGVLIIADLNKLQGKIWRKDSTFCPNIKS